MDRGNLTDAVVSSGDVIAIYESYANEPDTRPLRRRLIDRGVRLLLPVVNGADLDWVDDDGASHPRGGQKRMPEPSGAVVGQGAPGLAALGCTLIVVPALAVDHEGLRLGQGGGYYDRLLSGITELSVPIASLAIVNDEEILEQLPSQHHDESVGGWLTATGHHWVSDPSDRSRGSHH